MRKIALGTAAVLVVLIAGMIASVTAQQSTPVPWGRCCGMSPWPMGPGMMGRGMMGQGMMGSGYGSMPRQQFAMTSGIPAPYNSLSNPLPRTRKTVQRGAEIYEQNCASCHGSTGAGDGPVGRNSLPAARQSCVAFADADGSVGLAHVLDRCRGRRAVRQCDAGIQGRALQGRYLGGHCLHTGSLAEASC